MAATATGILVRCSDKKVCPLTALRKRLIFDCSGFRESRNPRDPRLLAEAYTLAADALADIGEHDESATWRARAAVQTAKAQALEKWRPDRRVDLRAYRS